jgi:predicted transcriptional regulator
LINDIELIPYEDFKKQIQELGDALLVEIANSNLTETEKKQVFEKTSIFLTTISPSFQPKSYEFYT